MSYTGIQEAYTLLLYSLMATNILNFVSVEHLALWSQSATILNTQC